jgi:hypothetical protein
VVTDAEMIRAFLAARLDEDERIARGVQDNSAPWNGEWANDRNGALRTRNGWVLAYLPDGRPFPPVCSITSPAMTQPAYCGKSKPSVGSSSGRNSLAQLPSRPLT